MLYFNGFDEKHKTKDILIENLCWNDTPITELDKNRFVLGEFTENIRLKASEKAVQNLYFRVLQSAIALRF